MDRLEGKVAVVTGAGRGLGRRVALRLAALGADVALIARSAAQLEETEGAIAAMGRRTAVLAIDLARELTPDVVRAAVEGALGRPAVLVNAAGLAGPLALIKDSDPAEWIETMTVNMLSHYRQWVDWVAATGGDDPEKAADLIARLVGDAGAGINGQFLWIENGIRAPVASW